MAEKRLDEIQGASVKELKILFRLVGKQLQRNPKIMDEVLKTLVKEEPRSAEAAEAFLDDVMDGVDTALESFEDPEPVLERMLTLAGVLTEARSPKALPRLILVTDAEPRSELVDIMFNTDVNNLILLFQGAGKSILRDNPTLYLPKDSAAAKKDAQERLAKAQK